MEVRVLKKVYWIISLTAISLTGIAFHFQGKTGMHNLFKIKETTFLSIEQEFTHSREEEGHQKQIIVWSKTRSGSSFLGELLGTSSGNVLYYFEPVATLWPSFWELSNSTTPVKSSLIVDFLHDILLCNFQQFPEYLKECFIQQKFHMMNYRVDEICLDIPSWFCEVSELIPTLCKVSDVLVAKVVRIHLRHAFEMLHRSLMHPNFAKNVKSSRPNSNSTILEKNTKSRQKNSKNISDNIIVNLDQSNSLLDGPHRPINSPETAVNEASFELKDSKYSPAKQRLLKKGYQRSASTPQKHFGGSNMASETKKMNLRIIHLVRDPRATLLSRRKIPWAKGLQTSVRHHCYELKDELKHALQLKRLYPSRYRLVRYEWLVLDVEAATRELYYWLDLPYNFRVANYLATHTMGLNLRYPISNPFSTFRNTSTNAFKWRETMEFEEMLTIQRECKEVIVALGYRLFENLQDYLDPLLSPMLPKTFLDA